MKLFLKTFKNELGNQIDLTIDDIPERGSVKVKMSGPKSESCNEMTYLEAAELRDALRVITI
jgi:hypothetical protein